MTTPIALTFGTPGLPVLASAVINVVPGGIPPVANRAYLAPTYATAPTGFTHNNATALFDVDPGSWVTELTDYDLTGLTQYTGSGTSGGLVTNLTTALSGVARGQYLVLPSSTTFTGNFTIGSKTGSGWIYIISQEVFAGTLGVAEGDRITVAKRNGGTMPKIQTTNSTSALTLDTASYVRFVGVDINLSASAPTNYGLVTITNSHHIVFDRCVGRQLGTVAQSECARFMHCGDAVAQDIALLGCRLGPFTSRSSTITDTQPLYWARSDNNRCYCYNTWFNAATEAWLSGGGGTGNPTDLIWDRCHFYKDPAWGVSIGSGGPLVKSGIELKKGNKVLMQRCIIDGLDYANNGNDDPIGVWSANQGGDSGASSNNVQFRWNEFRHCARHMFCGFASYNGGQVSSNIEVVQCKWKNATQDINGANWFCYFNGTTTGWRIEYCTAFPPRGLFITDGGSISAQTRIRNNIWQIGTYGFNGSPMPPVHYCVVAGGSTYPTNSTNNQSPANIAAIKFVDYSGGNWALAFDSPYKGDSSDGVDPGCDDATLQTYLAGVEG